MDKLEKLADVRAKIAPEVEHVKCCNCCFYGNKKETGSNKQKRFCNCCTKELKLERAITKAAKTFGRWISH